MGVPGTCTRHQITRHFTLRHGLASVARHRRLCIRGRESKGGGHAFAALTVGSRRVVNNRDVICKIIHPTEVCWLTTQRSWTWLAPSAMEPLSACGPTSLLWSRVGRSAAAAGRIGGIDALVGSTRGGPMRAAESRVGPRAESAALRPSRARLGCWAGSNEAGALARAPADAVRVPGDGTELRAEMAGYVKRDRAS